MRRLLLCTLVFVAPAVRAEEPAKLPAGAVARLGPPSNTGKDGARSSIAFVAVLADGRVVTAGMDATLRSWDVRSGKELSSRSLGSDGPPTGLTPGGRGVLLTTTGAVKEWQPGQELTVVVEAPAAGQLAVARDGRAWSHAADGRVTVYAMPGEKLGQVRIPGAAIQTAAVSSAGRYVALISAPTPRVQVWELDRSVAHKVPTEIWLGVYPKRLLFSPDGRLLVYFTGNGTATALETATGRVRSALALPGPASGVFEVGADSARATLPLHGSDTATAAEFSPDGRYLAIGHSTGLLYLHDLASGRHGTEFAGHRGAINSLSFNADGASLATAGADGTVVVWNVAALRAGLPAAAPEKLSADAVWTGLGAQEGKPADAAIWHLVSAPQEALALLRERLKPVSGPDMAAVGRWVTELDDGKFAVREKAYQNLLAQGPAIRGALETALATTTSLEVQGRLTRLIDKIGDRLPADRLRARRAVEVLEKIGGAEARAILDTLAKSGDDEVRREIEFTRRRWK